MGVDDYLRLLDWTGRHIRDDKPGSIPQRLAPILDRLALTDGSLLEAVAQFGKSFRRCVGAGEKVAAKATEAGKHWFPRRVCQPVGFRMTLPGQGSGENS